MKLPFIKQVKLLVPRFVCVHRLRDNVGASVLLSFDDGPHPETTPAVLDRLRAFDARAVFFIVGDRIPRAPALLSRIIDEGHTIGNHTHTHPIGHKMRFREYLDDLTRCQDVLFRKTGIYPYLHRPPMGQFSFASIMAPRHLGLTTVMWSSSAEDWQFRNDDDAKARATEMADDVRPRDILLFHDQRVHTLVALDHLLPQLVSRGIRLNPDLENAL